MGARTADEPGSLTSWWVLLAVVAALTGVVVAGVIAFHQYIRERTIDSATQSVVIISSLVVDRSLTLNDIQQGLHRTNRATLDSDVILLANRGQLLGLKISSLETGRVLYVDPLHVETNTQLDPARIERGRAGKPFSELSTDPASDQPVLRVYYPYDANGDNQADALAEVMLPRKDVDEAIARWTRLMYVTGALVLILALAGVYQVRRRQLAQDHATVHDALTGLGNRLLLQRRARTVLNTASPRTPAGLLLIDLDGFKGVNDTLGHNAGDELLRTVAATLGEVVGDSGIPVRLGGDEFAVLLPRLADPAMAVTVAERVREGIRRPLVIGGLPVEIDASIGIAYAPPHGPDLSRLLHCADVAMYRAKQRGGGVAVYSGAVGSTADAALAVVSELRQALADGQLELHFRPLTDADGRVRVIEALPRWRRPGRGVVEAAEFLPAVERTPMLPVLTEWLLHGAVEACATWRRAGVPAAVAVDLTARDLVDADFPKRLAMALERYDLPAAALRVTVSERTFLREPRPLADALAGLRRLGVGVTLGDAGAAYLAAIELDELPFDEIKLAPAVVDAVGGRLLAAGVVRQVTALADTLGVAAVADRAEGPTVASSAADPCLAGVVELVAAPALPLAELVRRLTAAPDTGRLPAVDPSEVRS